MAEKHGLGEMFKRLGFKFLTADRDYELRRGLAGTLGECIIDEDYHKAVIGFLVDLHEEGLWRNWERWMDEALDQRRRVVLASGDTIAHSRSARLNKLLCILLHAASRFRDKRRDEDLYQIEIKEEDRFDLVARDFVFNPHTAESYERFESDMLSQPVINNRGIELPETHSVPVGLIIAPHIKWIGQAGSNGNGPAWHLGRRKDNTLTVGHYQYFAPCIGQEPPPLLEALKERIDINSLRIRQKDWKWY